ncbi:RNA polymerase sigma-70 factor, ECF subfamily [Fodinibius roseus]|uniref:RNA polymerase sigma-70 factor, ECF subfamily n=1 Tax=Fodinibius roseus TaxID=1194090 RepID=A0A1M5FMX2_9BACT|nr:RNA polymerase sigma-70 factor [Fodinibius roseus]SHF92927.1 RNA polymerase sigma-70 factor, ECF subfamily [Fodinibius roseus]
MGKYSKKNGLVERFKHGDQQAFAELYDKYHGKLFRFALSYLKSKEEAEDVVHDLFVKLWEKKEQLQENENFDAYLFTVSKNHILNRIRNKKVRRDCRNSIQKSIDIHANPTIRQVSGAEYKAIYDKALTLLPDRRKQVYLLSRQEGLTYKEIAAKLDISKNTVEVHIVRALKSIRNSLDLQGDQRLRTLIRNLYS